MNDLKVRKIGTKDYEFRDYKFPSKASKRCRSKMIKSLRSREKEAVRKEISPQ